MCKGILDGLSEYFMAGRRMTIQAIRGLSNGAAILDASRLLYMRFQILFFSPSIFQYEDQGFAIKYPIFGGALVMIS